MKLTTIALPLALLFAGGLSAAVIDFEDRTGPSTFGAAGPAQIINYTNVDGSGIDVTFNGGVILRQTTSLPANQSSLYGTAHFGTSLSNPIRVDFSSNITNFYLDVLNGLTTPVDYRVYDNLGNTATFNLVPNLSSGATTIGFAAAGDTVYIESLNSNPAQWDFFIDNIHFNEPLPPDLNRIPEPATFALMGGSLTLLGLYRLRRR